MIKQLQKLKSKRGFTIVELVVVLAIIGIVLAITLSNTNNRQKHIQSANTKAQVFYSTMQAELMRLQMCDGPLTMTLADKYSTDAGLNEIRTNERYGGLKYFPAVGGNYPFYMTDTPLNTSAQLTDLPKESTLYIEAYVIGGFLKHVDYSNTASGLYAMTGSHTTELGAVLMQELADRMDFEDGYYYAKIVYNAPSGIGLSANDYKSVPVTVEWAAYTTEEVTTNANTYTFGANDNVLKTGKICGVCARAISTVGTAGSALD